MRPHDLDPTDELPALSDRYSITLPFVAGPGLAVMIQTAVDRERADAWLQTIDPALVPIAHELQASTPMDALEAADTVAAWWHGVRIEPADELRILHAAGEGDSLRAATLRLRIAADDLAARFLSIGSAAAAVRPIGQQEVLAPLTRRERRAQRRAARRGA